MAPYQFNQRLPFDIDYKVMTTFLEFYTALLRFVNHKLFTDLGYSQIPDLQNGLFLDVEEVVKMQKIARKKFDMAQHAADKY